MDEPQSVRALQHIGLEAHDRRTTIKKIKKKEDAENTNLLLADIGNGILR